MRIPVLILFVVSLFIPIRGNSQIVGKKPMETPVQFIVPKSGVSIEISDATRPGHLWIVCSDRNNNKTFKDTLLIDLDKTIDFLDPFYVIEDKGEIIHIIKDPELEEGIFSFLAEDYGWIKKGNMLLWQHCLVSPNGTQNLKGLVQNTLTEVKQERVEQGVTYFYNPRLKSKSQKLSRSYEILYIYKINGNALLLGKSPSFFVDFAKENILGWIPKNQVTQWDHNIALEVNWDKEAANERKNKEQPAIFYYEKLRAKKYGEGGKKSIKLIIWDKDTYENRPAGNSWRFPLIELDTSNNVVKANVFNSTIRKGSLIQTIVPKMSRFLGAFAPLKIEGNNYPLFNFVFLLSKQELSKTLKTYNQLLKIESSNYVISTNLNDFWREKLKGIDAIENITPSQIDSLTFNDISKLIFNVDGISVLSKYRLSQLTSPPYISDQIINQYFENLKIKQTELNKIFNSNNYEYGFKSFDIFYYWIDRRLFPL